MTATSNDAARLTRRHGGTIARAGWAAKGFLYAVVGVLALRIALGSAEGSADQQGALKAVAEQSFGSILLVLLIVGLVAYAVGRVLEATFFCDDDDGLLLRARAFGSAAVHAAVALLAVRVLTGSSDSSRGDEASSFTADVLDAPFGRWAIALAGVGFVVAGFLEAKKGYREEFMEELDTASMSARERRGAGRLGVAGLIARGVVWVMVGWFLVQAAVQHDPKEAKGLDRTLRSLADESWGTVLLVLVALGFVAYGAFCAVQARYRRVET